MNVKNVNFVDNSPPQKKMLDFRPKILFFFGRESDKKNFFSMRQNSGDGRLPISFPYNDATVC